jgi:Mrp family chromosome partitioning ATPase
LGEITDALRRARLEQESAAPSAEEPTAAAARAGAASRPAPRPPETGARASGLPPRAADAPVATFPRAKLGDWAARALLVEPRHAVAESFRAFAIRVRPIVEARAQRTVLVTSALRREGKTTTACNLALALASMAAERRIALVDLDLHRPSVARGLAVRPSVGIERALDGEVPLAAARIATEFASLDVFAAESARSHAHEVLSGRRVRELLEELSNAYDVVVIDTPPVLILPDVSLIAPHVGACIPVVRARSTPTSAFREMLARLPADRLIGCFLNDARLSRHARYDYTYHDDDEAAAGAAAAG